MPLKRRVKDKKRHKRLAGPVMVIDSPMGSGKTTYMLDYVKQHPEQQYLIITPYLTEVGRWDEAIPHLKQPSNVETTKTDSLESLLAEGASIITTHSLFDRIGPAHLDHISNHNYTLIIDETITVIEPQPFHQADIEMAVDAGVISYTETKLSKRLKWEDAKRDVPALKAYKDRITKKEIICGPTGYFWCMNRWKLLLFRKVFVLTYMFEASYMAAYVKMKFIDIPYEVKSLGSASNGTTLTDYHDPKGIKYRELIEIVDKGADANRIEKLKGIKLSKTGYDKITAAGYKKITDATRGFFNKYKSEKKYYMFTTFIDYKDKVTHPNYNNKQKNEGGEEFNECFVQLNARASNKYAHKKFLAYLVSRYPRPDVLTFLASHGSQLSKDGFALAELLQWIFRSAIRNDQPIKLFIPDKRMRGLLKGWIL